MGKDRISSQEIADYTNINATQIRRDLSNFGKFGKRGVGYSIDGLLTEIRKILRTQGQHNIALVGAGRLGQAIAGSPIFGEHGINIAAVFDNDESRLGEPIGAGEVIAYASSRGGCPRPQHRRRRARRPRRRRPGVAEDLVERGRPDHLQLHRGTARHASRGDRPHLQPRRRAAARALLPPVLSA